MDKIFVQIASYRDPELAPTIKDLLDKATNPENIDICIAWQHGEDENIDEIKNLPNIKIIDIKHTESKGVCWARSLIQQEYANQQYTLCLDSHHRFEKNWDEMCIQMINQLQKGGHEKPLLTAYLPSFNPQNDPKERALTPWKMNFDRFIPEGAVFFLPAGISNSNTLTEPISARFISAHFIFTLGKWNLEVPYDPNYYFHGEEINLAVRSFTYGYDLFHPHKVVAWHEYTRKGRTKQWDDDKEWHLKNISSHLRNRKLFGIDNEPQDIDFEIYGFGKERTLHDYEKYSGISFKDRSVQQYTLDNHLPPNPPVENWEKSLTKRFKHCIDIPKEKVPENDYDFWCVIFKDKDDKDIYRKDADENEIMSLLRNDYYKIWREFNTEKLPAKWVVWPHSIFKGWCEKIEGSL